MKKYRKAVFVVIYSRNKGEIEYLILRRKLHWRGWEFPKGGLEKDETKRDAVKREVREESGLKLLRIKRFDFSGRYLYKKEFADRLGIRGQTFSLYAAEVKKGKVRIDKREHSGYKWMRFREAVKKVRFNNQKKSLRIVNKRLKNEIQGIYNNFKE